MIALTENGSDPKTAPPCVYNLATSNNHLESESDPAHSFFFLRGLV